jgi:pyruvate dehydrogenase E2 component (dihydrolipoamide acetyltransferase)
MDEPYTVAALSPLRKVIAARMADATRTIPHFRLTVDVEFDALLQLRKQLVARQPAIEPSLNDMLIKACATALTDAPAVNIQWAEGEIRQYRSADIAVVTAIDGGIATPIVRSADVKSIWQIAAEVADLRARATRKALRIDEIAGGSFSISNLGMYGVDQFDAIVNPPQCAILAIGAAKPQVLASPQLEMRIARVARMTLSLDHRAIDGATGAAFLATLRRHIEHPEHLQPD